MALERARRERRRPEKRDPPPPIEHAHAIETEYRHGRWRKRREVIYEAMQRAHFPARVLEAFAHCGARAHVYRFTDAEGGFHIRAQYCHGRYCKPCASARALLIVDNLTAAITSGSFKHVVLTLKHHDRPFAAEAARLYACFAKLRRSRIWLGRRQIMPKKLPANANTPQRRQRWLAARHRLTFRWKDYTTGGATFFQTHPAKDGCWHHHFHTIAESKWIPAKLLARAWKRVTGDSDNVSVRDCTDAKGLATEVARYCAEPVDHDRTTDVDQLAELMRGLHGRHLFFTWGKWRGLRLTTPPARERRPDVYVGSLVDVAMKAARGCLWSKRLLEHLAQRNHKERAPPTTALTT